MRRSTSSSHGRLALLLATSLLAPTTTGCEDFTPVRSPSQPVAPPEEPYVASAPSAPQALNGPGAFPACETPAGLVLQAYWSGVARSLSETARTRETNLKNVGTAIAPLGCLIRETWAGLREQRPETLQLEEAFANFSKRRRYSAGDVPSALSWQAAVTVSKLIEEQSLTEATASDTALRFVDLATNPERLYAFAFEFMSGDGVSFATASTDTPVDSFSLTGNGGSFTMPPTDARPRKPDDALTGVTIVGGEYGQRFELVPPTRGANDEPIPPGFRRLPPPPVRKANRDDFVAVANNPINLTHGLPGLSNRTLDLGEAVSIELAAQPAAPGTWLRSVSVLTSAIPSCIVVPWAPEVVATESDVELTALLSRILVSGRCSQREELTLKLVSSESNQEQQVTLVFAPYTFEVRVLPALVETDLPGFSESADSGHVTLGVPTEILPRLAIRGLDGVELDGEVRALGTSDLFRSDLFRSFSPPQSAKLVSTGPNEWRTADDLDLVTLAATRLEEVRTEKGLQAFPLTSDPERLWFSIELAAEKPDRYRVRRYFSVPVAR